MLNQASFKIFKKLSLYLLLVAIVTVLLSPLLLIFFTSIKDQSQIYDLNSSIFPKSIDFSNYLKAFQEIDFPNAIKNTLYICFFNVMGVILASSLAAYAFAVLKWWGRDFFFVITIATMMLPEMSILVPQFLLFKEIGIYSGFLPLIVPYFFGLPYYIFLFRQFFLSIPSALADSARVDGASELKIWADIYMPLSKPIITVVALFQFLISWNDLLKPSIFLIDEEKYTLSLALQQYLSRLGGADWGTLMSAAVIMVIPILIIFFFTQKTLIRGITVTGMKD